MKPVASTRTRRLIFILSPILLVLIAALAWWKIPALRLPDGTASTALPDFPVGTPQSDQAANGETGPDAPSASQTPAASPTVTAAAIALPNNGSAIENLDVQGVMILAMRDGQFIHLFAYHPLYLSLTRITNSPWDDMTPALSPDGKRLAFSSRQNGYWDLYIIDLETGMRTRLTDTPEFETSPTWAPDGQWIAYQRFDGSNQDIYILPLNDPTSGPIRLTDSPGLDYAPAWSPQGRQIAFVSDRTGDEEIWMADLDKIDDRFSNVSQDATAQDRYPSWSRDGERLAWSSERNGERRLVVWRPQSGQESLEMFSEGERPAWSPDGSLLFSVLRGPNQVNLTAYQISDSRIALQPVQLPGALYGMTWIPGPLPAKLREAILQGDQTPPPNLYRPILSNSMAPIGRMRIVELQDVTAPQPMLHDVADEAFNDLRAEIGVEAGWDALSSLENAFVAITTPNDPGNEDEWLYTGRAFALNPLLMSAGWMVITREDFNGQTYWRVYLKARYQDGSMGMPISETLWDLNSRYSGNTRSYEQGGRMASAPAGYWIDLTELAARYGWERLPSLSDWRTYYPAIRFNQFAITGGLDWHAAMSEIYPAEALVTITPQPTYTSLPSVTPETPMSPPNPTLTPTITPIPTRRPTWTPLPNFSP